MRPAQMSPINKTNTDELLYFIPRIQYTFEFIDDNEAVKRRTGIFCSQW